MVPRFSGCGQWCHAQFRSRQGLNARGLDSSLNNPQTSQDPDSGPLELHFGELDTFVGGVVGPVEEPAPTSITRLAGGNQVVDFGQNIHGRVRLTGLGAPGEKVTLVYGEALDAGGEVTQDHLRPHGFRSRGGHRFQYVSVQGLMPDLQAGDITACQVQTDLEPLGTITNISPSRGPEVTSADPRAPEPRPGHARSIARPGIPREGAGLGERRLKHGGLSGS